MFYVLKRHVYGRCMGVVVEWGDRVCVKDHVTCCRVRSGLFTLGTESRLDKVTNRIDVEG
jgi:hypothetical protein